MTGQDTQDSGMAWAKSTESPVLALGGDQGLPARIPDRWPGKLLAQADAGRLASDQRAGLRGPHSAGVGEDRG